jgi:hypothetical protein
MAVEEVRARLRHQREEPYGVEAALVVMERRRGGRTDHVTNQTLF